MQRLAIKKVVIILLSIAMSACSSLSISPWVKPYERDNLADAIMSFDRNPIDSSFMTHGFGNREAAIGAEGSGGGGCGCN
ncbi:DUF4266 domain-containing protein [Agarilytica rhodophyticola]|uniref:DUF4266 domain-containing protein n=1 Tax=Agarilytica rhodophyticola TaxID=1737490 RepID=UPI000B3419A7|nr:DUF4266 domain-containing protein [Agarilytica rhodophyticola]